MPANYAYGLRPDLYESDRRFIEAQQALEAADTRKVVSEAVFEKMLDGSVARRLYQDPRYRNAENAEQQQQAEETIEAEALARLESLYVVA